MVGIPIPGVVNFRTFIDDKEIKKLAMKNVTVPVKAKENPRAAPAYIWSVNFNKGQKYKLVTEYDLPINYSNAFYTGREIPEGAGILWFDTRSRAEARYRIGGSPDAWTIDYFLHPLKLWSGGKPESIVIKVVTPKDIPSYYFFPLNDGFDCIDKNAMYFRWKNAIPDGDFKLSYPNPEKKYKNMQYDWEYQAWAALLAASFIKKPESFPSFLIKRTCAFQNDLLSHFPVNQTTVRAWREPCVSSCE